MKFSPDSWSKAARAFETSGVGGANAVSDVVTATTDAAACNAASGLATVDGAVAMMLQIFGEVMQSEVVQGLTEGFSSEVQAMDDAATAYALMEEDATAAASSVEV